MLILDIFHSEVLGSPMLHVYMEGGGAEPSPLAGRLKVFPFFSGACRHTSITAAHWIPGDLVFQDRSGWPCCPQPPNLALPPLLISLWVFLCIVEELPKSRNNWCKMPTALVQPWQKHLIASVNAAVICGNFFFPLLSQYLLGVVCF